jgi:hypothetical protein
MSNHTSPPPPEYTRALAFLERTNSQSWGGKMYGLWTIVSWPMSHPRDNLKISFHQYHLKIVQRIAKTLVQ